MERLLLLCAKDVVDALLDLFGDMEKVNDWHDGCLALAELARQGLLLPIHCPSFLPLFVIIATYRNGMEESQAFSNH
jgi:hypothetical protein